MAEVKLITLDNLSTYKNLTDTQIGGVESTLTNTINSVKSELEQKIADLSLPIEIVTSLPAASANCLNKLYLIAAPDSETNDIYQEYVCYGVDNDNDGVYDAYYWEKFGTVSMTEITSSETSNQTYNNKVVIDVGASGNTVTYKTATLNASTLGALTGITHSGTASTGQNAVSAVTASGSTVTVTYTTLPTSDDVNSAIDNAIDSIKGAATSAGVTVGTAGTTKVTSAITSLAAGITDNVLTITTTSSPIDLVSSLKDLGYDVADTEDIEGLFAST